MAAAIPFIVIAASTLLSASSQASAGAQAQGNANFRAGQLNQEANATEAASQRTASEQRRQAGIINSRVQALAAGSGASATDPTVLNIEGNIAKEGEYNALTALYNGDTQAGSMRAEAVNVQKSGANAASAGSMNAFSTILSRGSSLYDKYSARTRAPTASTG